MSDEKPFPIHGSVLPKEQDPLLALVNVDRPAKMTGSIGFAVTNKARDVSPVARFNVTLVDGKFTSVSAEEVEGRKARQGVFKAAFGDFSEQEIEVFNLDVPTQDVMALEFFFDIAAGSNTFVSPNGRALMQEITDDFAMKIASAGHTPTPITIRNPRQFPPKDIPLPRPGESKLLALTSTRFSAVIDTLVAQHNPQRSHVSRQLLSAGSETDIAALDNHEQRHMDIASMTCALGNVFVDVAAAAKTGAARTAARRSAVRTVFPSVQRVIDRLNRQYDSETNHGIIAAGQQDWDANLADKVLAAWRSENGPKFKVKP
jgi:hypothetical protein